jgi:hypothetical protein
MVIAIRGAEPEVLPVALEIAEQQPFWKNPVFSTLLAAFAGAGIGLGVFVLQQRYTRQAEAQKRFEEKKIENGTALWKFFHNIYPPLVQDTNLSEVERVRNVRETLLQESVYPLLPLDIAVRLNRLCDQQSDGSSPLVVLDTMFRTSFAEFMSQQ